MGFELGLGAAAGYASRAQMGTFPSGSLESRTTADSWLWGTAALLLDPHMHRVWQVCLSLGAWTSVSPSGSLDRLPCSALHWLCLWEARASNRVALRSTVGPRSDDLPQVSVTRFMGELEYFHLMGERRDSWVIYRSVSGFLFRMKSEGLPQGMMDMSISKFPSGQKWFWAWKRGTRATVEGYFGTCTWTKIIVSAPMVWMALSLFLFLGRKV